MVVLYGLMTINKKKNLVTMVMTILQLLVPVREEGLEAVMVTRTGPASDGGYVWTVTFLGDGDDFGLAVQDDQLVHASATVAITTTITGHKYINCNTALEIPGLVQGTPYYVRAFDSSLYCHRLAFIYIYLS